MDVSRKVDGQVQVDYTQVKAAFERNYACMGILCSDVGGIFDSQQNIYKDGAAPCRDSFVNRISENQKRVALAVSLSIGGLMIVAILVVIITRSSQKKAKTELPSIDGSQPTLPSEGAVLS